VGRCPPFVRVLSVVLIVASLTALSGCRFYRQTKERIVQPVITAGDPDEKAGIYHEIALKERDRSEAFIQIIGPDIDLPPTPGDESLADTRTYLYDVWVNNGLISDPVRAIEQGELVIDVANADATLLPVTYGNALAPNGGGASGGAGAGPDPLRSKNLVRVAITSTNLTQSFTIIAKVSNPAEQFEAERRRHLHAKLDEFNDVARHCDRKCRKDPKHPTYLDVTLKGEHIEKRLFEPNPYMAMRTVRVFNGDLHTQVYMLSDHEVRDAFGSSFARAFYVGRAYFRNRHTDKKLIVHTTSLRARTLFYREPEEDTWFGREDVVNADTRFGYIERLDVPEETPIPLTTSQEQLLKSRVIASFWEILESDPKGDADLAKRIVDQVIPLYFGKDDAVLRRTEDHRNGGARVVEELILESRRSGQECAASLIAAAERTDIVRSLQYEGWDGVGEDPRARGLKSDTGAATASCLDDRLHRRMRQIVSTHSESSPIALDVRRRVGLTNKIAAASQDIFWQAKLARQGYLWEDFYRPMTFEAVLLSLTARTRSHWSNRVLDYLESLGVLAGALVGMDQLSTSFGQEGFAQRVAVTTGVFVPELKKLFMKDIDLYLSNLASTALPSILTLAPNESRDGYVFFPRGPIFGYGVDEFSISSPSFIVNIDNEDVAVDGALIQGEVQFSAGQQSVEALVGGARSQGQRRVSDRLSKLAEMQARVYSYQMRYVVSEVCELLSRGEFSQARSRLNWYKSQPGGDNPVRADLEARAIGRQGCEETPEAIVAPSSGAAGADDAEDADESGSGDASELEPGADSVPEPEGGSDEG
jgi:hypothetical protein